MKAAARNKQPPENMPVSASIFPCPYGWSSSAGFWGKRKTAPEINQLKKSLAGSNPAATNAYEFPTTPTERKSTLHDALPIYLHYRLIGDEGSCKEQAAAGKHAGECIDLSVSVRVVFIGGFE